MTPLLGPVIPGPRAAAELVELVRETVAANVRREVLVLRLGGLNAAVRSGSSARRLLREALEPLMASARVRVFDLPNGDVVAVAPYPAHQLELARNTLAQLLDETDAPPGLIQPLRLPDAAATLIATVTESLGLALAAAAAEPPRAGPGKPLDAAGLARAERALAGVDLAPFTFGQAVCRLDPDEGPLSVLWQDRRVSLPALLAAVLPGVDPDAAPALRRRLALLAEARMVAALAHPETIARWQPVGIAISLSSLAGQAFQKLDAVLPGKARQGLVLALEAEDILADPKGFDAARDMAAARGYRLALEARPELLALLPPARLGIGLVRLRWSPDAPRDLHKLRTEAVLTGVDRPAALAWGWERGITLFQGPLIERRRGAA
jgi:hypothetical protein